MLHVFSDEVVDPDICCFQPSADSDLFFFNISTKNKGSSSEFIDPIYKKLFIFYSNASYSCPFSAGFKDNRYIFFGFYSSSEIYVKLSTRCNCLENFPVPHSTCLGSVQVNHMNPR